MIRIRTRPFEGRTWTALIKGRAQQDPLIHAASLLYELAHFRDVEKNVQAWDALPVKFLPKELPPAPRPPARGPAPVAPAHVTPGASAPSLKPAGPEPLFAWVHLSDIHWGHGGAGYQANQELVFSALERDLAQQLERGIPQPTALLVTGDIAFSGEQAQYNKGRERLLRLASKLKLDHRHIFTVPGNHDVRRAADKDRNIARLVRAVREGDDDLDEVLADDADRTLLGKRMTDYWAFAAGFAPGCLGGDTSSLVAWSHRMEARGGLRVRLVGLNTALVAADHEDKGKLRLGMRALQQGLATLPEDNELIIVLSHHPLRDDWLKDGRAADRWLNARAHVHLFGHVHSADLEETRSGSGKKLIRIAAGAVHGDKQPEGVSAEHGYSLAALYAHQDRELLLRVWPRKWSEGNTDFRADVNHIDEARGCAEHVIAGIQLAKPT